MLIITIIKDKTSTKRRRDSRGKSTISQVFVSTHPKINTSLPPNQRLCRPPGISKTLQKEQFSVATCSVNQPKLPNLMELVGISVCMACCRARSSYIYLAGFSLQRRPPQERWKSYCICGEDSKQNVSERNKTEEHKLVMVGKIVVGNRQKRHLLSLILDSFQFLTDNTLYIDQTSGKALIRPKQKNR